MTNDTVIRYARPSDFDALMRVLDGAFGFPSERTDGFLSLLPKLYRPEMTQLIAEKNGEVVGAVGMFERRIDVCGSILTTVGIGNVACRADMRGEGIMSALMKKAVADIIASGADLSDLGGRRHRYSHFGYECAGKAYNFTVRDDFAAHTGLESPSLSCAPFARYVSEAESLYNTRPVRFVRDSFEAVTASWGADRYAFEDNGVFAGYALVERGRVTEMMFASPSRLPDAVCALFNVTNEKTLTFTLHETDPLTPFMHPIYDGVTLRTNEQISVFNFKKTVAAYAEYATSVRDVPDAVIPLHICGAAGEETFTLEFKNGRATVTDSAHEPLTLGHHDAVSFLFGLVSPHRFSVRGAESVLPLPIYIPSPDCV